MGLMEQYGTYGTINKAREVFALDMEEQMTIAPFRGSRPSYRQSRSWIQ